MKKEKTSSIISFYCLVFKVGLLLILEHLKGATLSSMHGLTFLKGIRHHQCTEKSLKDETSKNMSCKYIFIPLHCFCFKNSQTH